MVEEILQEPCIGTMAGGVLGNSGQNRLLRRSGCETQRGQECRRRLAAMNDETQVLRVGDCGETVLLTLVQR